MNIHHSPFIYMSISIKYSCQLNIHQSFTIYDQFLDDSVPFSHEIGAFFPCCCALGVSFASCCHTSWVPRGPEPPKWLGALEVHPQKKRDIHQHMKYKYHIKYIMYIQYNIYMYIYIYIYIHIYIYIINIYNYI